MNRKALFSLLLISLMMLLPVGIAQADGPTGDSKDGVSELWTNTQTEVHPELGPEVPGLTPGENGYKVFNPGAITIVPVKSVEKDRELTISGTGLYREGRTDTYLIMRDKMYAEATHNSESDLFEEDIRVEGAIKQDGFGWADNCVDPESGIRSGHLAHCQTSMPYPQFLKTYIGHSWHHFHTTGYVDDDFQSEDRVTYS